MSSAVNEALLDALLSRFSYGDRAKAENIFQSIPIELRVPALMDILSKVSQMQPYDEGRSLLSAVLLRRDTSRLGGVALKRVDMKQTILVLLQNLLEANLHLIQLLRPPMYNLQVNDTLLAEKWATNLQLQLVYILSEICSSSDFLDPSLAQLTIQRLFQYFLGAPGTVGMKLSLRFLSSIAQQCPISMWQIIHVDFMENFFISTVHPSKDMPHESMESLFEAFSYTCIASDISYTFMKRSIETDDSPQTLFLQRIFLQTELSLGHLIDGNERTARLGRAIVPNLLLILSKKYSQDCSMLQRCMNHLVHCASVSPTSFVGDVQFLSNILERCCQLCINLQDTETRLTILDFISSLLGITHVQLMLHNHRDLVIYCACGGNQFPGLLKICADIIVQGMDYEDLEGWSHYIPPLHGEKDEYWDGDESAYHGQELLESILRKAHIDSDSLVMFLKTIEVTLCNHDSPQCKEAALRILEACIVALPDQFSSFVYMAIDYVCYHSTQGHFRLQYQCAQFISTLCESQWEDAEQQTIYGLRTMQCLHNLLHSKCDKVVAKTCFAWVTFCRTFYASQGYDPSLMKPILHEVVSALLTGPLSDEGNLVNLTHAVSAVAALAGICAGDIIPFYDRIMPGLLSCACISQNENDERVALHGAAIEAASIVILSVLIDFADVQRLNADAARIMDIVVLQLRQRCDHGTEEQLLRSSSRIARVLEESFNTYLPSILQYLLSIASEPVQVSVTDGNDGDRGRDTALDEDTGLDSITIALPGLGNKRVSLNTYQIEQKIMVANALRDHADALGSHLGTYAPDILLSLQPLVQFQYSAEVRIAAARSLSSIFSSLCDYDSAVKSKKSKASASSLFNQLTLDIVRQLITENDDDICTMSNLAESISELCYCAYGHFKEGYTDTILIEANAREVVQLLLQTIQKCKKVNLALGKNENDESSAGENLLTSAVDAIGYILKSHGPSFLPIFEELIHPFFSPFLKQSSSNDILARHAAVCLYDDCVEHCGPSGASAYASLLLNAVLDGIDDNLNAQYTPLKQASVYGVIQLARHVPHSLASCNASALINKMLEVAAIGRNARKGDIEHLSLVENAVSALSALCLCPGAPFELFDSINKSLCLDVFLQNLPIQEDEDEAKVCHKLFVDLIKNGSIQWSSQLPLIVQVAGKLGSFIVSEESDLVTEETLGDLARILKQIDARVDPVVLKQHLATLPSQEYNGYISIISNY